MRRVFDTCQPRPQVLSGELKEDIFAARLKDVIDRRAVDVYQDPDRFFEQTFPTAGLRALLGEALGRLTGRQPANSPIIRLETAFGGGKTHNLIALYHAARGSAAAAASGVVEPGQLPMPGQVRVAGVVGSDLDPSTGLHHEHDRVRTFTLWGELAYQLAGPAGYALAEPSDRNRAAPGTGLFEELVGDRPTLIMIDEIARHMRAAQGVPTATGRSNLAEQTVAFLMSLFEFAASRAQVVVVVTLADAGDAFARETEDLRQQLGEARRVSARQERVITPTAEPEIAAIVCHRLFSAIDPAAAVETAQAYRAAYLAWDGQNVALPQHVLRAEHAQGIAAGYPFHPELLDILNRKVSTIPNFQKTRGALRLLALVVRRLWEQRPPDGWLIHPHHVDLTVTDIVEDLTSRLERPAFKQVIEADIVSPKASSPAHAQTIDQSWLDAGKPAYAWRVATTVFLHSLTQGVASGVDPADLMGALLQPGDEPLLVDRAAGRLNDNGWFLNWDGHRYRFQTEPQLNKIVSDEMGMVGRTKAKAELDNRIRQVWKRSTLQPVFFPQEASNVDDDAGPLKLVVLHYDATAVTAADPAPTELVIKLATHAGTLEGYRRFRNNLVFLVADRDRVDDMVETAQRYLSISRITGDAQRMAEFTPEQRTRLKKMGEAAELDVRVAITRAYRHLYFPTAGAPQRDGNLMHDMLPAQDQGEVTQDQSTVVLRALRQQNKVLSGNEPMLGAAYVKSRAWDTNQVSMTTEELRKAYARRLGLPVLLDVNQLKKTIVNGIQGQVWVYYDAAVGVAYDHNSPPPAVQITDEVHLYLPEEAARLSLPLKGTGVGTKIGDGKGDPGETCPVCGHPVDACTCGKDIVIQPQRAPLRGHGVPQHAFQQILDLCHDQGVTRLSALEIDLHGEGSGGAQHTRTLGLIVPQLGKGEFEITQQWNAEFGSGQYLSSRVRLSWDLYRRLKQVTDALAQEASKFVADTTLHMRFEEGLELDEDRFKTIHEVMTTVGLDVIEVHAQEMDGT